MSGNFMLEISCLEKSKKIDDKLMCFSIYYEVYNSLISKLESYDKDLAKNYINFLSNALEVCVKRADLNDKNISYEEFIIQILDFLSNSEIVQMNFLKDLIIQYKNDIHKLVDNMKYVDVINEKNINFAIKTQQVMLLRNHINDVFSKFIEEYGQTQSYKIRKEILNDLSNSLSDILKQSDLQKVKNKLIEVTAKIILKKYENNEFDFYLINNGLPKEFFEALEPIELKLYILKTIYMMAGYEFNDSSTEKLEFGEIASLLNITENEYIHYDTSIGFKMMDFSDKILSDMSDISTSRKP